MRKFRVCSPSLVPSSEAGVLAAPTLALLLTLALSLPTARLYADPATDTEPNDTFATAQQTFGANVTSITGSLTWAT